MRRGNKSHKVPNVKLRPALAPTRPARDASCDQSSDSEMPPDASIADLCPRPFRGFTICATGTMDKSTLFKMAFELGAASTSDFTDRVTHLIANSHGGAKYSCALGRKIPIMTPEWITESHAIWLRGDDVNVEQVMARHRQPIFSGVVLSLSGVDDIHRRTEINRLVTAHQGVYLENLERPVRVTHLLFSGDTETDKKKYAEKFNMRKEAHIHLVWEEWFWDCLEFGGRFDERKYQVSRPRPERKSLHDSPTCSLLARDPVPGSHPSSAIPVDEVDQPKRSKHAVPTGSFTVINNLAIDGEEEEMAIVDRPVPAVTLQLWQSLLKPRGFEIEGGKLVRSPSKSQVTRSPPSTSTRANRVIRDGTGVEHRKEKESVISTFRRTNSFAPVPVKELGVRQPFRRNTTCPSVCEAEGSGLHDPAQPERESTMPNLFTGHTFRLLGEARCSNVRFAIENGGGVVTDDDIEDPSFIVVRLISGSKLYHDEFDDHARTKYRTECWLEHSVFHERICEPDENVSFIPLKVVTPVPHAEKVNLSLSGLDQSELCWVRRLVRALGITLEPIFSRRSTHLLCPSGTGAKFDKALEWYIPVVSLAWLEDIARTGTIPQVDEYLVSRSIVRASVDEDDQAQGLDPVPAARRDKGKGREKDVDYQMMDITNDGSTNQPMFIKSATLLQDAPPRNREPDARQYHRDKMSDPRSPARVGLFGKPRFLTHDSDPPEEAKGQVNYSTTHSPVEGPPQSSSPLSAQVRSPLLGPVPPAFASLVPLPVTPVRRPSGSIRDARADADSDSDVQAQAEARIPSSTSPSPMKLLPPSSLPGVFISSSPAPPPDTDAITKALHESLTSLLGKRPIAEEDEAVRLDAAEVPPAGGGGDIVVAAVPAPKGKRVRPGGRSNVPSRNASRENVGTASASVSPHRPIVRPPVLPPPQQDIDMSLFDGLGTSGPLRSADESARVTYEDPRQAEEKRRLLRMLGGDEVDSQTGAMGTKRPGVATGVGRGGIAGGTGDVARRRTKRAKVVGV